LVVELQCQGLSPLCVLADTHIPLAVKTASHDGLLGRANCLDTPSGHPYILPILTKIGPIRSFLGIQRGPHLHSCGFTPESRGASLFETGIAAKPGDLFHELPALLTASMLLPAIER
jgi:hypothetical protein